MNKKIWFVFVVVAMIIAMIIISIISSGTKIKENKIYFGAVLPLTGELAEYGKRCKSGIDLAVEEVNKAGGIKGQQLAVIYEDSRGIAKEGVSAINKLVAIDRVKVVVGAVSSSVTLAMEPIATKNKVILFSPASSSPKLTGISKYFFRDWPSDVYEAIVLAEFVRHQLQFSRVGVLYVNNDYGLGLKDEFVNKFTELGGTLTVIDSYAQGASDFRTQLAKILKAKPEGVYLAGYHREMAAATKQIRELGIDAQILGAADYGVDELLEIAGKAAEGAIYSIPEYDPHDDSEAIRKFTNAFQKKHKAVPSIFEANAYDAVYILCNAISSIESDSADAISDYISQIEHYKGASGDISFGQNREVIKPISIKIVKNGEFVSYPNTN